MRGTVRGDEGGSAEMKVKTHETRDVSLRLRKRGRLGCGRGTWGGERFTTSDHLHHHYHNHMLHTIPAFFLLLQAFCVTLLAAPHSQHHLYTLTLQPLPHNASPRQVQYYLSLITPYMQSLSNTPFPQISSISSLTPPPPITPTYTSHQASPTPFECV